MNSASSDTLGSSEPYRNHCRVPCELGAWLEPGPERLGTLSRRLTQALLERQEVGLEMELEMEVELELEVEQGLEVGLELEPESA